jgi:hypothetical protein
MQILLLVLSHSQVTTVASGLRVKNLQGSCLA